VNERTGVSAAPQPAFTFHCLTPSLSGLAHSLEGAERVRRAGATAVIGDLAVPGLWQDEAQADWVFHLPPYPFDVHA
jgi:hypothetical protein